MKKFLILYVSSMIFITIRSAEFYIFQPSLSSLRNSFKALENETLERLKQKALAEVKEKIDTIRKQIAEAEERNNSSWLSFSPLWNSPQKQLPKEDLKAKFNFFTDRLKKLNHSDPRYMKWILRGARIRQPDAYPQTLRYQEELRKEIAPRLAPIHNTLQQWWLQSDPFTN